MESGTDFKGTIECLLIVAGVCVFIIVSAIVAVVVYHYISS
ncbi:MAG: hypothetical protein PHH85_01875 [Candidatus Methanoperedens sp.]|nr:hypothetical protein [Candidatus Methanoperedens sp.]